MIATTTPLEPAPPNRGIPGLDHLEAIALGTLAHLCASPDTPPETARRAAVDLLKHVHAARADAAEPQPEATASQDRLRHPDRREIDQSTPSPASTAPPREPEGGEAGTPPSPPSPSALPTRRMTRRERRAAARALARTGIADHPGHVRPIADATDRAQTPELLAAA